MTEPREPFSRFLARMEARGFQPSRKLGQNFLLDPSLHRAIASAAELGRGDVGLEIGGGLGFLTRELAASDADLVVVEIDPRLHAILSEELASLDPAGSRIRLVLADALGHNDSLAQEVLAALSAARGPETRRFVVVANLPYAVSGPLLARLPLLDPPPDRMVVLVQLELGQRLCALVGSGDYGSLSATLGAGYRIRIERKVGREVFRPRPNVDSALVVFDRLPAAPLWGLGPQQRREFSALVRALFSSRRKTLSAGLPLAWRMLGRTDAIPALPAQIARARPEELGPESWVALFEQIVRCF